MPDATRHDRTRPVHGPPAPPGLVLSPFRALRYRADADELARVTSPPYDVVDDVERARLASLDEHNVVRLILPHDDARGPGSRYLVAADTLRRWQQERVLERDVPPAVYVYEMAAHGHVQRGLVGALALVDPAAGIVLPHENTMAGPVSDRLELTRATGANLEPIFLVYDGGGAASEAVAAVSSEPLASATTDDGVRHRVWALTHPDLLHAVAADLLPRRAVIADGHHRYATYLRYQAEQHAAGAGPGPWDSGLALLVDARAFGPRVGAIHRVLRGLPFDDAVRRAATGMRVEPAPADLAGAVAVLAAAGAHGTAFVLADGGQAALLTTPEPLQLEQALPRERSAAWRSLDVTVAHRLLIARLLGLPDEVGVVDYAHDAAEAVTAASASGGTALLLNPTPVADVVAVAAAGERMPRKSTLFFPKPRTGLLLRLL